MTEALESQTPTGAIRAYTEPRDGNQLKAQSQSVITLCLFRVWGVFYRIKIKTLPCNKQTHQKMTSIWRMATAGLKETGKLKFPGCGLQQLQCDPKEESDPRQQHNKLTTQDTGLKHMKAFRRVAISALLSTAPEHCKCEVGSCRCSLYAACAGEAWGLSGRDRIGASGVLFSCRAHVNSIKGLARFAKVRGLFLQTALTARGEAHAGAAYARG